ncbi:MAG TPA: C40 family peptidase [Actinomycetota bacterium]|nr:C40 family peptidase [Actinomycetota bacterium]
MRRWFPRAGLLLAVLAATLVPSTAAYAAFTDVPTSYWDYTAIDYVGQQHTWMQDYGTSTFKPTTYEQRRYLARTLVTIYAPNEPIDPSITFTDLPSTDPFYRYANVSAKLDWLPAFADGTWGPTNRLPKRVFDRALILAMGDFTDAIYGLQHIHMGNGTEYSVNKYVPYMQLASWLGLHYNHDDETMDVGPKTDMKRDEVAYSVWEATTMPTWQIADASVFDDIEIASVNTSLADGKARQALTDYALDQIGYPYVWGGEWNDKTPTGYCCGAQPIGGMDCSGFVWWTMKRNEGGYNAAQFHPTYTGWALAQRTSSDMAANTGTKITWSNLKAGDLMFFSSSGGTSAGSVDHVGFYLGRNWMINSASGTDGVVIEEVSSGWFYDHFVYGRRIIGSSSSASIRQQLYDPRAGEAGSGPPPR